MADQKQYRILTPDGRLSHDTFVVASEQPGMTPKGCVLVINDRNGTQLTVHRERLFLSVEAQQQKRVCLRCGRVSGVVEDQVQCPYDEGNPCELLEPPGGFSGTQPCVEHSA